MKTENGIDLEGTKRIKNQPNAVNPGDGVPLGQLGELALKSTVNSSDLSFTPGGASLTPDPFTENALEWQSYGSSTNWQIKTIDDGKVGTKCIGSLAINTPGFFYSKKKVPLNNSKSYKVTGWFRRKSGNGRIYGVIGFFDKDGNLITGSGSGTTGWVGTGTMHYWMVEVNAPNTDWIYSEFIFGANGAQVPVNAKFFSIGGIMNLSQTVAGEMEIQGLRVEEVLNPIPNSLSTSMYQNNSITSPKIPDDAILLRHIAPEVESDINTKADARVLAAESTIRGWANNEAGLKIVAEKSTIDGWADARIAAAQTTIRGWARNEAQLEFDVWEAIKLTSAQMLSGSFDEGIQRYNSDLKAFLTFDGTHWNLNAVRAIGPDTARPTLIYKGFKYYDTTLGQALRWDGQGWVIIATGVSLLGSYSYDAIPGLPTPSAGQVSDGTLPGGWSSSDTVGIYDTVSGSTKRPLHSASGGSYSKNRTYRVQQSSGAIYHIPTMFKIGNVPSAANVQFDFLADNVIWYQPNENTGNWELRKITLSPTAIVSDNVIFDLADINSQFQQSLTKMYCGGPSEGIIVGGPQIGNNKQFATMHCYNNATYCFICAYNITDGVWTQSSQVETVQDSGDTFDFGGMSELGDSFGLKSRPQSTNYVQPYYFYKVDQYGVGPRVVAEDTGLGHSWGAVANINGQPTSVWMSPIGTTMRVFRMDNGLRACPDYTIEGDWSSKGHGGMIKYTDWAYCTDNQGNATAFKWDGSVGCALGKGFIRTDTDDANLSISGINPDNPTQPVRVDFSDPSNVIKERTFSN